MLTLDMDQLSTQEIQQYLQYAIAPRPICFASTIDLEGNVNLSPFSFFNLFSMNPPICIFSPSRRVRDNTTKHTLENIKVVPECVINIVNYNMVQQMSLSSCDYPKGTNEFTKAGFTELASEFVKPPRVAEAPIQLECIVQEVITLGENAGAGNLVLALIKKIHIKEEVLDGNKHIDQTKLDLVARLGGDWYARITEANLFKVEKPNTKLGIGFDQLPVAIIASNLLTNNEKAQLANFDILPESNLQQISSLTEATIVKIKLALANQETAVAWEIIRTSI
ncbi:MAG TPA: flavin reductase [Chitinophagaceae bacterium]|jgi:flavin reductase (DIM6/NTAB) family NADH-FMN oxidoreductase RutF|nr:flavin reductase [Chitinophagaceae bacterium]